MGSYFKSPPFFITIAIFVFVGIVAFVYRGHYVINYDNPSEIKIVEKWKLPKDLDEVSGITYLDKDHLVCNQDEDGKIFIYNLSTHKVERTLDFASNGDYEGITLVGKTAYVVRSDGKLYEVNNITEENTEVKEYETPLTEDQNIEGLCYDKENNRLLLAIKGKEKAKDANYKGVYAFNLKTKKLESKPIYKLKFDDKIFSKLEDIGEHKVFRPSEIAINPKNGDIYLLDAKVPKILILDKNWKSKSLYVLDPKDFQQPEGITFTPDGKMYISNEKGLKSANILNVSLEKVAKTNKK